MYDVIVILKALTEVAGVAVIGQGVLYVLAGAKRDQNLFYRIFKAVTSPVMKVTRWVPIQETLTIARQMADALDYATCHSRPARRPGRVSLVGHPLVRTDGHEGQDRPRERAARVLSSVAARPG